MAEEGRVEMVDVGGKPVTDRRAVAGGFISVSRAGLAALRSGSVRKGDVFAAARVAGIMGAKEVARTVPLCHPLALDSVKVDLKSRAGGVGVTVAVRAMARTGVEMEALAGAAAALLTVYDMLKSADRGMVIGGIRLLSKTGGRSGEYRAAGRRRG